MNKEELIKELHEDKEDSFTIFSKGYLEHFDMDEEIFSHLFPKLVKESSDLMFINDTLSNAPENVSDEVAEKFKQKAQDFFDLVQELCLEEVQTLPYVAKCARTLRDEASPDFLAKIKRKIDEGYSFVQDQYKGSFNLKNPQGEVIFSSAFVPMKEILSEAGIDTNHQYYPLFYFGLIPKDELHTYRLVYTFKTYFQF